MRNRYRLRILSYFIILTLLSGLFSVSAFADTVSVGAGAANVMENDDETGDKNLRNTESDTVSSSNTSNAVSTDKIVVEISSPSDLIRLAQNATIDAYTKDKCFVLTRDLDMIGNYRFETIPVFSGIFDGRGHYIKDVTYGCGGYVTGLFRYVDEGAVIQNLNVQGHISSTGDKQVTGGIAGINHGLINACTVEGSVEGKFSTGGIVGINEAAGRVKGCTNYSHITGYYYTGGIAGKNYGDISYSYNKGAINNTEEWVEGNDAIDPRKEYVDALMSEGVENAVKDTLTGQADEQKRYLAGVDTGGIAGFSRGGIFQCKNSGVIGYDHVGYNVGGIAGRQSGVISYCGNEAKVLGRKDIGGVVGQMEPNLSLSDLETLPEALDSLHDMVDVTLNDMDDSMSEVSGDMDQLSQYADNAVTAGNDLGTSAENYINDMSDNVNKALDKVDYITEKVPGVMNDIKSAGNNLSEMSENIRKLIDDLDFYDSVSENDKREIRSELDSIEKSNEELINAVRSISSDETAEEIIHDLTKINSSASDIMEDVNGVSTTVRPYVRESLESVSGNSKKVYDSMDKAVKDLKDGIDGTRSIFDHVNNMPSSRMAHVGSDFDIAKDDLRDNLSGMADTLSRISRHSSDSSHQLNNDLSEVNDQLNKIFHLISDEMERISDISLGKSFDDLISDVSDEEIDTIISGKVENSYNKADITGDINVGGITGSMDIDSDDPEQNAAGDMDGGFTARYLLRNAVIGCKNDAEVRSKRDGAGGIAGYMAHGVVAGCESFGAVTSVEGGYAGGIAGQSNSIVKESYSMSFIKGKSYLGGITGYGTTITGCTAFPTFVQDSDRCGAIAGMIETDKDTEVQHFEVVSGNRFINDQVAGIDGISIRGRAEPVSYREIMSESGTPDEFGRLRIIFQVEDVYVKETSLPYGTSLSELDYPELPPVEGKYVVWKKADEKEKLKAPLVIDGEPVLLEKTLESIENYPGADVPLVLLSGTFIKDDRLDASLNDRGNEVDFEVSFTTDHHVDIEAVRFYDPYEKSELYGISDGGVEHKLDGEKKGSYIEVREGLNYNSYRIKNTSLSDRIKSLFGK